jgi:hypothetical protein
MPFDRSYASALLDAQRIASLFREAAQRAVLDGLRDSPSPELIETLRRNLKEAIRLEDVAASKYKTYLDLSSASARR